MAVLPIYPGTPPPIPTAEKAGPGTATRIRGPRRTETDPGEFQRELDSRIKPSGLTFSRHAQKRLEMRGIMITPQGLERIEGAVDRAAEKGSRNALILAGAISLVVSVTNRTVVTVMNRESMEESLITNIDSAVFA